MNNTPDFLKDANKLLTPNGFKINNIWYHGTSSALVDSIMSNGLIRSGDKAIKEATKSAMATIGNSYTESVEPVFLTQSKELAYFWAEQTVKERSVRFEGKEKAVVFAIELPNEINSKVLPDVGAASLLMIKEGESYMAFVASLYQASGAGELNIDLMQCDRLDYLYKLGMAYLNEDINTDSISLVLS